MFEGALDGQIEELANLFEEAALSMPNPIETITQEDKNQLVETWFKIAEERAPKLFSKFNQKKLIKDFYAIILGRNTYFFGLLKEPDMGIMLDAIMQDRRMIAQTLKRNIESAKTA